MAGYILKAAKNSPWKSKNKERWKPQPKQSNPKMVLNRHGIIYFSKLIADLFAILLKKYDKRFSEDRSTTWKFYTFEILNFELMKAFKIIIMILAISVAFYEQVSEEKNIYIMIIAIVIFMFGMMQLSAKTPSKNNDKEE